MTLAQFGSLLAVYLLLLVLVLSLTYPEFRWVRFNFNVFFLVLYLLTFYLGFSFTLSAGVLLWRRCDAGGKPAGIVAGGARLL